MHSFRYLNGQLACESVDLQKVAKEHGTPLYVYSSATILDHYRRMDAALAELEHSICYAVKANSNIAILNLLAQEGAGFDIVSAGELFRVIKAGGNPAKCTFAGVGKTSDEIRFALEKGIYCFNVESEAELEQINAVAKEMKVKAPVALRVNPDVEADTHKYISTGKSENKFGVGIDRALQAYAEAAKLKHLKIRGVQIHIGSQITKGKPFAEAVKKMAPMVTILKQRYGIEFFSIGGGMGIVYKPSLASGSPAWWETNEGIEGGQGHLTIEKYAAAVVPTLKELGLRILFEPGRFMVGNAGVLLTKVLYIKKSPSKTFVIVDSGMNDLIRPALYEGWHEIVPLKEPADSKTIPVDVVGPICESGDFFAQAREIPPVKAGDVLALMSAGAYGFSMASNYNSRPLPAEIMVLGKRAEVIRERQKPADLIRGEKKVKL
jgi:diaminopimelate decarboxylase